MVTTDNPPDQKEHFGVILGIFAISMSTLVLEITLTKFLAFKLFHHMTFAVLSMVILSFGAAGILTFTNAKLFRLDRPNPWSVIGTYAALYAISSAIVVPFTCWVPLAPYDPALPAWLRVLALPMIFLLYAMPFFCAGVCISQTLTISKRPVTVIYFWDLLAAALGAATCSWLLMTLSGYGTVALCSSLGLIAAAGYWAAGAPPTKQTSRIILGALSVLAISGCVLYPAWAIGKYGIDIRTFKEIGPSIVLKDFGGIAYTQWNSIARVDVSKTGTSPHVFYRWGLPPDTADKKIVGRYILLDGGCNTKSFKSVGDLSEQEYLARSVMASPWVAMPDCKDALILGGGGGIDILVAKLKKIPRLAVVEINPTVYGLLTGRMDPANEYSPWLQSDATTTVKVYNDEARHFAATQAPGTYDIIQASGVDTHTAIQSGGMSLVENYLYTVEAVRDFQRLLKPNGILSICHWRTPYPMTATRMFLTYQAYLDSIGVKEPWRHLVIVGTPDSDNLLLKNTPFTDEELARLRDWAKTGNLTMLFDPSDRRSAQGTGGTPNEKTYWDLAFADAATRQRAFDSDPVIPRPVRDDKPYFYSFKNVSLATVDSNQPTSLIWSTCAMSLFFLLLPMFYLKKQGITVTTPVVFFLLYFAFSGFAFLLYETAIIQMFSVFVGGPTYSLSVVLVAVLFGYALGSAIASRLRLGAGLFWIGGGALFVLFLGLYFGLPSLIAALASLPLAGRLAVAGLVSLLCSSIIAITVTSAMQHVRRDFGPVVAWMWGVSCIANALGSISFVAITQTTGIRSCLLMVAFLYLVSNTVFAIRMGKSPQK
jgi:spermidine synthase